MNRFTGFLALAALMSGAGAARADQASVWAGIAPYGTLVGRVAGERAEVATLVGRGGNPGTFAPRPKQVRRLASASVYFASGLPFEARLRSKIASVAPEVAWIDLAGEHGAEDGDASDHGDERGAHEHGTHPWMDPGRVAGQCARIAEALARIDPEGAAAYRANARRLREDLRALDRAIAERLGPYAGRAFFINHPSLGSFAEAYGLRQVAIEREGKRPSMKRVRELMEAAREAGARTVFAQASFGRTSARTLAKAIEAEVVEVDPLAPDYFANLRRIAEAVAASFGPP